MMDTLARVRFRLLASASASASAAHVQGARKQKSTRALGIPRESCRCRCCKWNYFARLTHPAADKSQRSRTKSRRRRRQVLAALKDHQRAEGKAKERRAVSQGSLSVPHATAADYRFGQIFLVSWLAELTLHSRSNCILCVRARL